jgi:hypothetical protein
MRLVLQLMVAMSVVVFSSLAVSADEVKPGAIQGTVNYCGLGGLDGMQVYVPGQAFVVITAEDGRFTLSGLPVGEYTLYYREGGRRLNQNSGIQVLAGQTTKLSVIAFCDRPGMAAGVKASPLGSPAAAAITPTRCDSSSEDPQCKDADGDGAVAALDCDDANATIYPGAVELCDGVDNNCNGVVDDNASANMPQAMGVCRNGQLLVQSCLKGYNDCDGLAANGCETDIMSDDENCGSCGNICSATESCGLGFC